MQPLKVEKKGGQLEDFDRNKVASSVKKAGGTDEQAESVASQVETWAQENAEKGVVKTNAIREKVIELLRPVNAEACSAYESYKKPA